MTDSSHPSSDPRDQPSHRDLLSDEDQFVERLAEIDESLASSEVDQSGAMRRELEIASEDEADLDSALQQAADVLQMMHRVRDFENQSLSWIDSVAGDSQARARGAEAETESAGSVSADQGVPPTNAASSRGTRPSLPKMIGRFQVVRLLGAGGFGLVYLAIDTKLDRRVAIKIPRPETLVSSGSAQRFLREGKAAAALNHPNIVPVYEAGEFGTVAYIASAYCPGSTLAEWLEQRGKPMAPRAAAAMVARLADAAQHAHRRGILHRDLKPSNVLLEFETAKNDASLFAVPEAEHELASCARISDFGLARFDNSVLATQTTSTLGTPSFMPPEQADPSRGEVRATADVYSLGAILYQLLTGQPPFREATVLATLDAVCHRNPAPPRKLEPKIPPDLEAITLKCLEKSCDRRYDSAAALSDDLERFLDRRPVRARRIHTGERFARWCRKNPLVAALACAVILLAIGSTVTSIRLAISRSETREALDSAVTANQQAALSEYQAQIALASSVQKSASPGQRIESLQAIERAAMLGRELEIDSQLELRNLAISALSKSDVTLDQHWPVKIVGESFLATSPDGEMYLHVDDPPNQIMARRIRDNRIQGSYTFERPAARIIGMRYSPDGTWIGVRYGVNVGRERLRLWNVNDGQTIADCEIGGFGHAAAFSSDGTRIAMIATDNHTIEIRRLPEFSIETSITRSSKIQTLAFSPDGQSVAVHRDGRIELLSHKTNDVWQVLDCPTFPYALEFSPKGDQLVAACRDSRVRLYSVRKSDINEPIRPKSVLEGHAAMVVTTSWHPSEPILATCSMDGRSRVWDLRNAQSMLELDRKCTGFSQDGRWLGIEGGRMRVNLSDSWQSFPQQDSTVRLPIDLGFYPRGNVTSEIDYWVTMPGRRLMIGQNYFRAVFRDAGSDEALADFAVPGCWFRFSADGKSLYASSQLAGLCRLPIQETETEDSITFVIGPPKQIHPARGGAFALTGDRCVVTPFLSSGVILNLDSPSKPQTLSRLAVHRNTFWSDISPDGRLAASGAMKAPNVRIFDANNGKRIKTLPSQTSAPWFSPDGKRLIVAENARYTIYETKNWGIVKRIETVAGGIWPGSLSFSPNGELLALEMGSEIHLVSSRDYSIIAKFAVPADELIESIGFSGDGRYLISGGGDQDQTHRWDLLRIRSHLRKLGLDWNAQESLPSTTEEKPIRVEVDLGAIQDTSRSFWPF